jgi:hypothetical protein
LAIIALSDDELGQQGEALMVRRNVQRFLAWFGKHLIIQSASKSLPRQEILEIADRMIKKHRADLEYLKDR